MILYAPTVTEYAHKKRGLEMESIATPFVEFPKIARYSREVIVSEKIDGTNGQIYIVESEGHPIEGAVFEKAGLAMLVGSRTRWLKPGEDNFAFCKWAYEHGDELLTLGPGRHFGEWWGSGIQRGYGLTEKRFSLFNVMRWGLAGNKPKPIPSPDPRVVKMQSVLPPCVGLVPELWRGSFDAVPIRDIMEALVVAGSVAAPGYMNPEGVVIFHLAGNVGFKKTLAKDDEPKSKKAEGTGEG